jgi:hypothetical protein
MRGTVLIHAESVFATVAEELNGRKVANIPFTAMSFEMQHQVAAFHALIEKGSRITRFPLRDSSDNRRFASNTSSTAWKFFDKSDVPLGNFFEAGSEFHFQSSDG